MVEPKMRLRLGYVRITIHHIQLNVTYPIRVKLA
jgi:hypothetical protein